MSDTPTEINQIDAEDLQLYIDNDYKLYNRIWTPTTTALTERKNADTYDRAKAVKAFERLINAGSEQYIKEFPDTRITWSVRRETAESMRDRFEIEYDLGNYNYLIE